MDGAADYAVDELDGKTPLMVANTPNMDSLAKKGKCGRLFTLPEGAPTSSDVANMSILGYDPLTDYTGRGPMELAAKGISQGDDEIAFRCNFITEKDGVLLDYSAGHISPSESKELVDFFNSKIEDPRIKLLSGVSYRNLLILKGKEFSDSLSYSKPDDEQGTSIKKILLKAKGKEGELTCNMLNELILKSKPILDAHPINVKRASESKNKANMIWPWSPGKKPSLESFEDRFGLKGAIISAVDVINGFGKCVGMDVIKVEGATGFIDTNYEGKVDAAVKALEDHDFVYLHVEAPDETSHMGDLKLKIKAIEDFDKRVVGRFLSKTEDVAIAVLPDHYVPLKLRKHTRDAVPFLIYKPGSEADSVNTFDEESCKKGSYGLLEKDGFVKEFLD